jgi:hypothetical protein
MVLLFVNDIEGVTFRAKWCSRGPPFWQLCFPFNNSFLSKLSLPEIDIYNFRHKMFWPEFKNHFPFVLNSSEKTDISHFQDRYKKLIKNIFFESFF